MAFVGHCYRHAAVVCPVAGEVCEPGHAQANDTGVVKANECRWRGHYRSRGQSRSAPPARDKVRSGSRATCADLNLANEALRRAARLAAREISRQAGPRHMVVTFVGGGVLVAGVTDAIADFQRPEDGILVFLVCI